MQSTPDKLTMHCASSARKMYLAPEKLKALKLKYLISFSHKQRIFKG